MHTYPPPNIRDYATPADSILLSKLEAQVENYSTNAYQTSQVEAFCNDFLIRNGFPLEFSFDPNDSVGEALHIRAYKLLRQGLFQFEKNGGHLKRLEKPVGAHKWIRLQQEIEGQQEKEGQDNMFVSEVETDKSDGENNSSSNNGLVFNLI